jgi:hypothetical protein
LTEQAWTRYADIAAKTGNTGGFPATEAPHTFAKFQAAHAHNAYRPKAHARTLNSQDFPFDVRANPYSGAVGLKTNRGRTGSCKLMVF